MRPALLAILLSLASHQLRASTAYEALQVVGKQRGEAILDTVTEVRGKSGTPQPKEWKILVRDKSARSGAKEFDVEGVRLLGEKSPSFTSTGAPMNMSQLNIDSDGVHQVAEREAKKVGFTYDRADYVLRAGTHGGSPVWEIRLVDDQSGNVATLNIAAATGNIISKQGLASQRKVAGNSAPPPPPPSPRAAQPEERYDQPAAQDTNSEPNRIGAGVNNFFDRIGRHMSRRGRQIGDTFHNLFSSDKRHTAGPHDSSSGGEDTRPANRPSNDSDYVQPSRVRD